MKFSALDLDQGVLDSISYMGFEDMTEIQEKAIPLILAGKDLMACAQTGTGKTGAFLIPMLHEITKSESVKIQVLIIVPTRELALQIDQQIEAIGYTVNVSSLAVYGGGDGQDWSQEKKSLSEGVDIVVATPGKLISHLTMGYVDFSDVKCLILDEADRMLDIGFSDDIQQIITYLPKERRNLMFSATMPQKIRSFAKNILKNPEEISLAISKPVEGVLQASYLVYEKNKINLIKKLIKDKTEYKSILIFSATKKGVTDIVRSLKREKMNVAGISSDLNQEEREDALLRFKAKTTRILVATDVISRGIDVKDINLVINYNVPNDAEDYVHRIGRTARADTTGVAITLIDEKDMRSFAEIERLIEKEVIKIQTPKDLGLSPNWDPKARSGHGRRPSGRSNNQKRKNKFKRK